LGDLRVLAGRSCQRGTGVVSFGIQAGNDA
jgi:hypothetical protein